jgi:hypothetical protein
MPEGLVPGVARLARSFWQARNRDKPAAPVAAEPRQ